MFLKHVFAFPLGALPVIIKISLLTTKRVLEFLQLGLQITQFFGVRRLRIQSTRVRRHLQLSGVGSRRRLKNLGHSNKRIVNIVMLNFRIADLDNKIRRNVEILLAFLELFDELIDRRRITGVEIRKFFFYFVKGFHFICRTD